MMKAMLVFAAALVASFLPLTAVPAAAAPDANAESQAAEQTTSVSKLAKTQEALRYLWTDHIFWIRNAVLATNSGNKDALKVAEDQVVANAHALANSVKPFYGEAASDKLFELLAGHWGAIKNYLEATYADNQAGRDEAQKALYANAKTIAAFLHTANPDNWPEATLVSVLSTHAAHHLMQVNAVHAGDFEKEAEVWAGMRQNANAIADALANGLAAQFPDKF